MRKIIFRGKCLTSKQWNYGCYVDVPGYKPHIIKGSGNSHNVDPETVGQYIGAHDTSGEKNKVFEGDEVRMEIAESVVIKGKVICQGTAFFVDNGADLWEIDAYYDLVITGNIHEGDNNGK